MIIFICALLHLAINVFASPDSEVLVYEHPDYKGWAVPLDLSVNSCWNMSDHELMASAIKIKCNCVKLYGTKGCIGNPSGVFYGHDVADFTKPEINFDNKLVSLSNCSQEEIDAKNLQSECGPGWVVHNDRCFQFIHQLDKMTPHQSSELCKVSGGQLASIRDANENSFLTNYISTTMTKLRWTQSEHVLTGGKHIGNTWMWENSGDSFSYTRWGARQPGATSDNKLYMMFNQPRTPDFGRWGTIAHEEKTRPLCMKLPKVLTPCDQKRICGNGSGGQKTCKEFGECTPGDNNCMTMKKDTITTILSDCGCGDL